ncbi:MAG: DUF2946 family protein [Xanthomonadales bacterium]|nr:DUF2946 family protein [Xanthomonadales bacterium]
MNLLRHPAFRFVRLPALLAVLLLATLPTLGRLQATPMAGMHAAKVALCTTGGLRSVQLDLVPSHDTTPPVAPSGHHQHDDCAYCPLLAGLAQLSVPPALHLLPPDNDAPPRVQSATRIASIADTGLGARGPPDNQASITA